MALLVYQQNLITFQAKPLNCWWREPCVSIAVWEYFLPWVGVTTPTYIESLVLCVTATRMIKEQTSNVTRDFGVTEIE